MANETGKFGLRSFVAIVCMDVILCLVSLGLKALLTGTDADVRQILRTWVIVPIALVTLVAVIQLVRMARANKWGCLPTVFFMLSMVVVWFIPIGH